VNCAVGYPFITGGGSPDAPVNHVLPAWDVACAATAALSLVVALGQRARTRKGAEMRLALSDVAFTTAANLGHVAEAEMLGTERPSLGNDLYGAFGRDFVTQDGRRVMIAAISGRQWSSLLKACGIEAAISAIEMAMDLDFRDESQRFEARDIIGGLVGRWCAARPFAEVAETFNNHGVCWGLYQSFLEMVRNDPRCSTANPVFQKIETEGVGQHLAAGFPTRFTGQQREDIVPAPVLGQHTDEILATTLGLSAAAIGSLHDRGIVAGPTREKAHG
jgi:2-methylfumaryl-CoA isomerase